MGFPGVVGAAIVTPFTGDFHGTVLAPRTTPLHIRRMPSTPLLVYGAYGYTGRLIVHEALAAGLRPVLSGRDPRALATVAEPLGLEHRPAALDDARALDAALDGMRVVLHCAGPFVHTSRPMADACLRRGVHYLDITGELTVFEALAARDAEARERGVTLLPGVGFDVVPSDCLAAHLARRLPGATHLALAFRGLGGLSRGTAATMAENAGAGGAVRRDGRIVKVPPGWRSREIDFGDGVRSLAATIPWGDVSTAYHSTGIPNVEVYMAMSPGMLRSLRLSRWLAPLLRAGPVRRWLVARARARKAGPSEASRRRGESRLWGEARDAGGRTATARLVTPEGYTLTARTAVASARRVLAGGVATGFRHAVARLRAGLHPRAGRHAAGGRRLLEGDRRREHDEMRDCSLTRAPTAARYGRSSTPRAATMPPGTRSSTPVARSPSNAKVTVMAGSTPTSVPFRYMIGAKVCSPNPHMRLEYVFTPAKYASRLTACEVRHTPEMVRTASDHLPLLVEISGS